MVESNLAGLRTHWSLVGGFVLDRDGASYKSQNLFNAVASIDDWAAPIMAEVGPDGNVWVLDWYNYIVQHNPTPTGFKTGKGAAYESDLRDKRFARVYRLIYGTQDSKPVSSHSRSLSGASASELIEALRDDNFFWRRTAQRLLVEKGSLSSAGLKSLVDLVDQRQMDAAGLTRLHSMRSGPWQVCRILVTHQLVRPWKKPAAKDCSIHRHRCDMQRLPME